MLRTGRIPLWSLGIPSHSLQWPVALGNEQDSGCPCYGIVTLATPGRPLRPVSRYAIPVMMDIPASAAVAALRTVRPTWFQCPSSAALLFSFRSLQPLFHDHCDSRAPHEHQDSRSQVDDAVARAAPVLRQDGDHAHGCEHPAYRGSRDGCQAEFTLLQPWGPLPAFL